MVITSRNNGSGFVRRKSSQFRYGVSYILITALVLSFLNIYCSVTSQNLFYQSKEASMKEKVKLVADSLSDEESFTAESVALRIQSLDNLSVTRMVVTNAAGAVLYDSLEELTGRYYLFPEVVEALQGNDVYTCTYTNGVMESQAATPLISHNTLIGCVYMMEYDAQQGALIQNLQRSILTISIALGVVLLLFTVTFSSLFTRRLQRIMESIREIRQGDYSTKVHLSGSDELTILGDEFNSLADRLQESDRRQKQFVSDASHELKTPLASIKLLSDSILQNPMDEQTMREFVSDIGEEADRLNRMSYKLLSLTKADSDDADCEIVFIEPTVRRVMRMLSANAHERNVTMECCAEQDCSILIREDDLYQILFNLVENGIKYNVSGGHLTVRLCRQEDNAVVQVADTGMGIPEGAIDHIFERFYRVDKARSRQSGGSGLGLAIVNDMVRRNRGTIRVESGYDKGSGTVFTVEFPVFDVEEDTI